MEEVELPELDLGGDSDNDSVRGIPLHLLQLVVTF